MSKNDRLKIVIVGGVAGGASAATRARRMNEQAEITLFEKDEFVSFANCGLPYYIGGEIEERKKLLVATPDFLHKRFRLDVRTKHEVTAINRTSKTVSVRNLQSGEEFEQPYDKLILSTGASPFVPPIEGVEASNVLTLRNIPDTDVIKELVDRDSIKNVLVVGAGFIGLEMVEQFVGLGLTTTLVELQPQVLPLLDKEMAKPLEDELRQKDVALFLGDGIQEIVCDESNVATAAKLNSGKTIQTDLILLGIGVRPNTQLAEAADLELGESRGIATNNYMQTNDPDIYAVGDAAEYPYGPTGNRMRIALAGPANRAGRLAGEHAATGKSATMASVFGTSIVRLFNLTVAMTGLTESLASRLNIPAKCVTIIAKQHAGYYPGAQTLTLKLMFSPDNGTLLGAEVIGGDGVDKRVDIIATAMAMKATVKDLAGLDLAYAPPFGSAKDPVHMAAFAACNHLEGVTSFVAADIDMTDWQVVDVRTEKEISAMPFPQGEQAAHIPLDDLRDRIGELNTTLPTLVVCASGLRSYLASRILIQNGFENVKSLSGGAITRIRLWED